MTSKHTLSRGDRTREALLSAAIEVFGHGGFDAASTRAIAETAGVNQALIGYHFGGKEGLYLAVFESIVEQMSARMLPVASEVLARLEDVDNNTPNRFEIALECIEILIGNFLEMIGQEAASGWVRLIFREQQDPTKAFEIIWDGVMGRLLAVLNRLIGLARDEDPDAQSTHLQAMTLMGQALVFVIARTTTARHMGWERLEQEQLQAIHKQLILNFRAQLSKDLAT